MSPMPPMLTPKLMFERQKIRCRERVYPYDIIVHSANGGLESGAILSKILWHDRSYHLRLPHDVGPARDFLGEAEKTTLAMCGLGPASLHRGSTLSSVNISGYVPTNFELQRFCPTM